MIEPQRTTVGLAKGGGGKAGRSSPRFVEPPTLAEAGIDKHLAQRAQPGAHARRVPTSTGSSIWAPAQVQRLLHAVWGQ